MPDDMESQQNTVPGMSLLEALSRAPFSIVLTDPRQDDNPIIYVNDTFETITGYAEDFAVGRNCRFLQQDDTDQPGIDVLRKAIKDGSEVTVDLRNYRPDGELFQNRLMISPLKGADGTILYFVGLQTEIETGPGEDETTLDRDLQQALEEVQHRVKNHLAMIVSMIRLQASNEGEREADTSDFDMLARRIETLQLLYEELSGQDQDGDTGDGESRDDSVALGAYLTRVSNAVAHLDGRSGVRVNIDAEKIRVPIQVATQLGLILCELTTNALQHAFDGREEGLLEIEAKSLSNGTFRLLVADDGMGLPEGLDWPNDGNLGSRIVSSLVDDLGGRLDVATGDVQGTTVTLDVPKERVSTPEPETVDA